MATGNSLSLWMPAPIVPPNWIFAPFTSGSAEPTPGDKIYDAVTAAEAVLEILGHVSGTWGGGDEVGYMLLSNWNGTAWTSGGAWNNTSGASADDEGTLTGDPGVNTAFATPDFINTSLVYDFDDTINECLIFSGIIPSQYAGGGITTTMLLAADAATADMSFAGFFRSFTDDVDNLLETAFNTWGTIKRANAIDAPSVIGEITYDTIAFSSGAEMDSVAEGEMFQFLLMCDAQDTSAHDISGDVSLVGMQFKES